MSRSRIPRRGVSRPSRGYRYFVEQLMEQVELSLPEQRMIRHQFHQMRLDLDQWMRSPRRCWRTRAQSASLVTPPHATRSRFRHLELISINDALCLMILVLQDGSIHQEMIELRSLLDQDTLSQTSNKLNALLRNGSAGEIEDSAHPELPTLGRGRCRSCGAMLI